MSKKAMIQELLLYSDVSEEKEILKVMSYRDLEELHRNLIDPEVLELIR